QGTAEDSPAATAPPEPAARPRRLNPLKVRRLEQQAAELEEQAAKLEQEIASIEQSLLNFVNAEEHRRRMELLEARRRELDRTLAEWEQVSLELEQAT
ncbi:MAG: ABC transporter ATP-binding protein, partial [Bryobacteraceae bacterium]